jgi:hypothetical protein
MGSSVSPVFTIEDAKPQFTIEDAPQKPKQGMLSRLLQGQRQVAESGAISQGAVGAAKGLSHTGLQLGDLIKRFFGNSPTEEGAYQTKPGGEILNANRPGNQPEPSAFRDWAKPTNTAQKVGFGAEQAAEFAVPGGLVTRGVRAADTAVNAARLAPMAGKALKLGARMGLEGAAGAGVAEAQGQDPASTGAVSALMPAASAALKPIAKAAAEKVAPQIANKLLRPVPTRLENAARFGRNPGKAVADEGIIATSHADLLDKIGAKKEEVGKLIGDALQTASRAGKTIDARPLIEKPIDDAIKDVISGKIEGGQAMIDRLQELKDTLASDRQMVNGKLAVTGVKNLTISPSDAHALKRQIGDTTKWSEDALTQAVNDVKRRIYRNLNDEIANAVPGVKPDQMRYGNLLEAEKSAERELARHEARNPFSLSDAIFATGAGTAGALLGGGASKAAVGAAMAAAASKAMRSPLGKTLETQAVANTPKAVTPEALRKLRNVVAGARSAAQQ